MKIYLEENPPEDLNKYLKEYISNLTDQDECSDEDRENITNTQQTMGIIPDTQEYECQSISTQPDDPEEECMDYYHIYQQSGDTPDTEGIIDPDLELTDEMPGTNE